MGFEIGSSNPMGFGGFRGTALKRKTLSRSAETMAYFFLLLNR
jgi:hypothetical protein